MNAQYLEQARAAYRAGDFSGAAQMFAAAKDATEIAGEVDHLRGNSLMKLGLWADAARAYELALADTSYGKRGALHTNLGKAYAAAGDYARAADSFREAVRDTAYATPYKAYMGLGGALVAQGNIVEAGTAYRQAAIDAANPAPAQALSDLAGCFIKLGRPGDAVETYRTALDFATPRDDTRAINAGLGQALIAQNRAADAVDAFNQATSDGIYQLTPEQQQDYQRALDTMDALSRLLPRADVVALSLPGYAATRGVIGKEELDRMKPGAVLLNVGRGTAVDTNALSDALYAGKLAGAGLDVTDPEPLPADHPLHSPAQALPVGEGPQASPGDGGRAGLPVEDGGKFLPGDKKSGHTSRAACPEKIGVHWGNLDYVPKVPQKLMYGGA